MAKATQALRDGRRVEKRKQPRFTAQFRSTFSGGQREGQGKTVDLSDGGCRIETEQAVVLGATFECRIYAPGLNWPLRIDEAQVRWIRGKTFGLEFTLIRSDEQVKLKRVIAHLTEEQPA
jgi:hypothetical protein